MSEVLTSVGLDVGTTSTQLVVSRLTVENRASSFSVPELEISRREILYQSPVHFTPLLDEVRVDVDRLRQIVDAEYAAAGIRRQDVNTGAIIITGETSRKENARAVLAALSDYAGDFVVATAGPDLESVLAAKGAGAVALSRRVSKPVLHMDIGGGTSNLSLIEDGKITATGCLNIGGRLLKIAEDGTIRYVSPVLEGIFSKGIGDKVGTQELNALAQTLAQVLEMAAGLRPANDLLEKLTTPGSGQMHPPKEAILSFSGGVADCIAAPKPHLAYGDFGPELGMAIRKSRLCQGDFVLGQHTIRATVIGAGSHTTQLSGSTVYHRQMPFPLKNLPILVLHGRQPAAQVQQQMAQLDSPPVLAIHTPLLDYAAVAALADWLAELTVTPLMVAMEQDAAKALGHALALRMPEGMPILCMDRLRLTEDGYLDVGAPVGSALPVVIKTLALGTERSKPWN